MGEHNELGKIGEQLAAEYLAGKEYKIIKRNWRFRKEEIDIIATKDDYIIFVEVKTRASDYFENPEQAVTKTKQKFLISAANEYLQSNDINTEARFDIISIIHNKVYTKINHLENAFYPTV